MNAKKECEFPNLTSSCYFCEFFHELEKPAISQDNPYLLFCPPEFKSEYYMENIENKVTIYFCKKYKKILK